MNIAVDEFIAKTPIIATGKQADVDRPVLVVVDPRSTAVEGVHFEMRPTIIPAGKSKDSVFVRLIRENLKVVEKELILILKILPNEEFNTDLVDVRVYNNGERSMYEYKIYVSDILAKPLRWNDNYYGDFSVKKFELICEVNSFPPAYMDGVPFDGRTISPADAQPIALRTYLHLEFEKEAGRTIYEADGVTEMTMGPQTTL
jgi:hypothetical protein